jgi:hypothetical protein
MPTPLSITLSSILAYYFRGFKMKYLSSTVTTSLGYENLIAFVIKFIKTYCVRSSSNFTWRSFFGNSNLIFIFWFSACLSRIATHSDIVFTKL